MERLTTFWSPSVVQKRFMAKGRSAEMTRTTVLGSLPPVSLNLRVEVAQTAVSRLGTMFRIFFLPFHSPSPTSFRSTPVSVNAGACAPFWGRSPFVWMGLPFSVTVAIGRDPFGWGRSDSLRCHHRVCLLPRGARGAGREDGRRLPFDLQAQEVVEPGPDHRDGGQLPDLVPGGGDRGGEDVGRQLELEGE